MHDETAVAMRTLWRHARLVTLDGEHGWEPRDGAIVTERGTIRWLGALDALPRDPKIEAEHDLGGALVTPGLVDCHTHLVYAGNRANEFERRLNGATYAEIAREGGGIASTVRATRAARRLHRRPVVG